MRVIPVIDILDGKVVHGVQGNRESYKPIKSILTDSHDPLEVAKSFKGKLGFKSLYIADLDSIEGKGDNFKKLKDIRNKLDIKIMLDYGITCSDDLNKDIVKVIDSIILGTETLTSLQTVKDVLSVNEINGVIVSIDIKDGNVISKIEDFKDPESTIRTLHKLGVNNFILLELSKVGSMEGPTDRLKQLILNIKDLNLYLITGGGIKSVEDIISLQDLGVNAVLIATALHTGKITKEKLEFLPQI